MPLFKVEIYLQEPDYDRLETEVLLRGISLHFLGDLARSYVLNGLKLDEEEREAECQRLREIPEIPEDDLPF